MYKLEAAARDSPLSRAQADEIAALLPHVEFSWRFVKTIGDFDRKTSLRELGKCDFFTREIDQLLLQKKVRAAVHSAKDLPDPLPEGLCLAALTSGVDPRDCIVSRKGELLEELPPGARIATSSARREEAVRHLRSDLIFCDVRGTIQERLSLLDQGEVDGVVVAEAALVRLGLTRLERAFLPGPVAEHQGRLAVIVREDDGEVKRILSAIDAKEKPWTILHLGLDPKACPSKGRVFHYPVIRIHPLAEGVEQLKSAAEETTHLLMTSKEVIPFLPDQLLRKTVLAIGEKTAAELRNRGARPLVAPIAEQEGMIELLETLDLRGAVVCYPRSHLARGLLADYLQNKSVRCKMIDLYETRFHRPGAPPSLDEIDEIVFMSSSCVEGFCRIYGKALPGGKKITCQGRLTSETCEKLFVEDRMKCLSEIGGIHA